MTGYELMPKIVKCALPEVREHLWTLYWLARNTRFIHAYPYIRECGVRSGESTRTLMAAAWDCGVGLISCDIDGDAYHVRDVTEGFGIRWLNNWQCVKADSVTFANSQYQETVHLVFIDTDHSPETTWNEINAWAPKIARNGLMVFHDYGLTDPGRDGVGRMTDKFAHENFRDWSFEGYRNVADGDTGMCWLRRL